jgi:tetratricopeptide (TPR) repeat protein
MNEALGYFDRALKLDTANAELHSNYGIALQDSGKLEEAANQYRRALELNPDNPDAHWNLGVVHLLLGEFPQGWLENEWRWKTKRGPVDPKLSAPLWDGSDLSGKTILLYCEQGLGDSIQFVRYAKFVKHKGGTVLLPTPKALARLFEKIAGIDRIIREEEFLPAHDYRAPLLSLPGIFKTDLASIPAEVPYIAAAKTELPPLKGKKIGVVWRGNPTHTNDHNRSMKILQFAKILKGNDITIVNLQKDASEEELRILGSAGEMFNPAPSFHDFADTAATVAALDLVITVDTSVCHLAGALGVRTWTLLPFAPDWRWLLTQPKTTPWYPSMRLYRQPKIGDWRSVIEAVRTDLAAETCA